MAKKTDSCGSCGYDSHNPADLSAKMVNMKITFAGALKLKAAVDKCVLRFNRLNRASGEALKSRMRLLVDFKKKPVRIHGPRA